MYTHVSSSIKKSKHPNCSSNDEQINKMGYMHTKEFLERERNEVLTQAKIGQILGSSILK